MNQSVLEQDGLESTFKTVLDIIFTELAPRRFKIIQRNKKPEFVQTDILNIMNNI